MASEPRCSKPGCGALKIVGKPCTDADCPQQWVHHTDTRTVPAATDTGLEAILLPGWPKLCEFSQAEELLSAERAKYRDAMEKLVESQRETLVWQQRAINLKSDNAAKDARVKVLDQEISDQSDLIASLEAKLAAAEQAARAAHETLIEINPSNYNHDDVCQLNDASVEAIFLLADILGETHGKTKEWWDERRAVLGGKPS